MTDKLHCPFCGAKLIPQNDIENTEPIRARCGNPDCPWFMWAFPWEIWQALIDGKKAQDVLKGIEIRVAAIRSCVQDGYTQLGERNRNIFIALELFKDLIKEITSITKQENE